MEYRQLGNLGVKVSPICLGTGFRVQEDDALCERVVHRAVELGCNFIDSANFYGCGRSEEIVGRALKGKRDDIVITSKVFARIGPGPNDTGLSRYHIMREAERSLKRLQTDRIDVYLQHDIDRDTPPDEIFRAMDDLVRQGKVIYTGSCNHPAWRLMEQPAGAPSGGGGFDGGGQEVRAGIDDLQSAGRRAADRAIQKGGGARRDAVGLQGRRPRFLHDGPCAAGGGQTDAGRGKNRQDPCPDRPGVGSGSSGGNGIDHGPDTAEQVDDTMGGLGWQLDLEDRETLDAISQIPSPRHIA